jgi:hypothetical protein
VPIENTRELRGPLAQRCKSATPTRESITAAVAGRESDGLVVARKRGNARGAKEPWQCQAERKFRVELRKKVEEPIAGPT